MRLRLRPAPGGDPRDGAVARAIAEVNAAVHRGGGSDEVLTLLARCVRDVVPAAAVTAMTLDAGILVLNVAVGPEVDPLSGARIPVEDTLAGLAQRENRTQQASLRRATHPHEAVLASSGLRRMLYAPIPGDGSAVGVLGAGRGPPGRRFTSRERQLIELFAGLAGLAIPAAYAVHGARRSAASQEEAVARERRHLARELHDSVIQELYGIGLSARAARALLPHDPEEADGPLEQVLQTASAGLAETRRLIFQLRPEALAGGGLADALGRLLDTLHNLHGITTEAHLAPEPRADPAVRNVLYRIAQEALQNAAQHARPTRVTIRLQERGPMVVMEVADDGDGFHPASDYPGRLGLRSMRERAAAVGGGLDILSSPGRGTVVRASLPTDRASGPPG